MVKYITLLGLMILFACNPFKANKSDKHFIKVLNQKGLKIEMYDYSTAYADTPIYLVSVSGASTDTICITTNLKDIKYFDDTLVLYFLGKPKKYQDIIYISPSTLKHTAIVVDTTSI